MMFPHSARNHLECFGGLAIPLSPSRQTQPTKFSIHVNLIFYNYVFSKNRQLEVEPQKSGSLGERKFQVEPPLFGADWWLNWSISEYLTVWREPFRSWRQWSWHSLWVVNTSECCLLLFVQTAPRFCHSPATCFGQWQLPASRWRPRSLPARSGNGSLTSSGKTSTPMCTHLLQSPWMTPHCSLLMLVWIR